MNLKLLHRFAEDRRGNVAMMFAFALVPLLVLSGGAIDFTQAARVKDELQTATDTAALAVARDGLGLTDAQLAPTAKRYVGANFHTQSSYAVDTVTFDRSTVTAAVDSSAQVPTTFLKLMGMSSLSVTAHSVTKGLGFEISLVLDTSGSMAESAGSGGSKITALKDATTALLNILYADQTTTNRFTIGIVPFAASVNVGSGNASASWMDTGSTPANDYHNEDFDLTYRSKINRFSLFNGGANGMKNVNWAGCVMTRPAPYDVTDAPASSGNTLFVPWFAPDEPDGDSTGYTHYDYDNNYLNDEGGNCTGSYDTEKNTSDARKQSRICKYKNATPDTSDGKGPNYLCTSKAITPLTGTRSTLDSAVSALSANGNTNVLEGFMWGWRVLSPETPFTQGKAYGAANNRKVIIMMTDGENNYSGKYNWNYSNFFAYGYAVKGHLLQSFTNSSLTTALDNKTKTACANAKAKGIIIYAIAFGSDVGGSQSLLQGCATDAAHFYAPANSSDLKPTFVEIAKSINALRIAQ